MRNRHFLVLDIVSLALAVLVSYVLRLDNMLITHFGQYVPGMALFGGLAVVTTVITFLFTGLYARYWRYASVGEMVLLSGSVAGSAAAAGAVSLVAMRLFPGDWSFPRSIPVIFFLLALLATAGPRLLARISFSYRRQRNLDAARNPTEPVDVLVFGAGDAGAMIVRELRNNPALGMRAVGFVDDDLAKHDAIIHGVPVLGGRADLERIVEQHDAEQMIIAVPTAPGRVIRELVSLCERVGLQPKIIPGIYELIGGSVSVSQLRKVEIEDLLRREPVKTDTSAVHGLLRGRSVLVTGGGGSIGSELCRQILRCEPAMLVVLGHGENSVFEIVHELEALAAQLRAPTRIAFEIADIRFPDRIRGVFRERRPHVVFHAAAHKHVPLMELAPCEAVWNNVLGTKLLLEAADETGVERFVMISTDKAVKPTSVMGASKRAAELLVHRTAERNGKPFVAVRFGNVLGSRGSVVLTFKRQIAAGGPVTVTNPEMTRYFMTIPEAVQLVLQAAVLGSGGEVFLLDMGEPVKIVDLARSMIELSGLQVGEDVEIAFTGTRPGEKLFEELFLPDEVYRRTHHEKIFIAGNATSASTQGLDAGLEELTQAVRQHDHAGAVSALEHIVPEFKRAGSNGNAAAKATAPAVTTEATGHPPAALALREEPRNA